MNDVFCKLWVHLIWSTKKREALMTNRKLFQICQHIKDAHAGKDFFVDTVNGWQDHLHCLVSFKPKESVSSISQAIKGESSHWMGESGLIEGSVIWQDGYAAFSVSESQILKVRNYIINQKKHHENLSFEKELESLKMLHKYRQALPYQ
jgi:putative transposase